MTTWSQVRLVGAIVGTGFLAGGLFELLGLGSVSYEPGDVRGSTEYHLLLAALLLAIGAAILVSVYPRRKHDA